LMPTGPVTHVKAWVEMIHRYAAMVVGLLIVVQVVSAWRWRRHAGVGVGLPLFTLLWVCLQGAFGAWTVTLKLQPIIVTGHLLGGMVLAALLQWQRQQLVWPDGIARAGGSSVAMRGFAVVVFALLWLQIALGAWVSTNYAVMACQDFPLCQGSWWPAMNFAAGFELWRPLGMDGQGQPIVFDALTAIHYTHRLAAYLVLVAVVVLAWRLRTTLASRPTALWLIACAVWQLLTGVSNVVFQWPLAAALSHTAGAAALVIVLTGHLAREFSERNSS
jgi:heme a synthase